MKVTEAVARFVVDDFKRSIPGVESWKKRVAGEGAPSLVHHTFSHQL